MIKYILVAGLFALTIIGCKKEKAEPIVAIAATTDTVSFSTSIIPILSTNCSYTSGCHDSGSGFGDFTSYTGFNIDATNGKVNNRVVVNKNMPPSYASGPTSLSAGDIGLINTWINQGALNN